jgi:hypothetical protein
MNEHMYRALHCSWASWHKRRAVDKKGLAVALIFLVAIALWAGEPGDKSTELNSTWQEQPDLLAHIEIRPAARISLWQSMTGLSRDLEDPRGR